MARSFRWPFRGLILFLLVALVVPQLRGQGSFPINGVTGTDDAVTPSVPPEEETFAERIKRLKRELSETEQAARVAEEEEKEEEEVPEEPEPEIPEGALVVVAGEESSGSGFIARMRDRKFFVTNIHVLGAAKDASIQSIEGDEVELPDIAFLSRRRDLAIVPVEWDGPFLEVSNSLRFDEVSRGDAITVMGNSDGAGVATRLEGKIKGIGPQELEISAKFVPGNSGSPIIHDELGKVVGLVSHMRDFSDKSKWTKDSELSDIRRYGFRLDGNVEWQQIPIRELQRQAETYAAFEDRTFVMAHTIHMLKNERTIVTGYSSHDSLGYLFDDFDSGFDWQRGMSSANNTLKVRRFKNGLLNELIGDQKETRETLTVEYLKRQYEKMESVRARYTKQLNYYSP